MTVQITWFITVFLGSMLSCYIAGSFIEEKNTKCSKHGGQELSFFDHSTRRFVHWLYKDPPVEIVKEALKSHQNGDKSLINTVVSCERPAVAVSSVSFLFAFASLIVGVVLLYRNVSVGKATVADRDNKNTRQTCGFEADKCVHIYLVTVVIISLLLLITDIALFQANNLVSKSFPTARRALTKSIDDLHQYQNDTLQKLNQILRDDFEGAVSDSMSELRALADCDSLTKSFKKEPAMFEVALKLASLALRGTREVLGEVNSTLRELQTLSRGLKSELSKMNKYYKEAQRFCFGRRHVKDDEDLCELFVNQQDVFTTTKPLEMPNNISDLLPKLDQYLRKLRSTSVYKVMKSRRSYKGRLCAERASKLRELEKVCNGIRIGRNFLLDTVKKYSDELANKTLLPMRKKVNTVLAEDGVALKYDRYRWWIAFLMSLAVIFVSLTTMLSLAIKGAEPFLVQWTPTFTWLKTTTLERLPKQLLLSSVGLHASLAIFANISAGIVFIILSNMVLACDVSTDYDKLDNIIGTSSLLKESKLFSGRTPIKVFKKISECPKDGTIWTLFDMDKKFNINKTIAEVNKIPVLSQSLFRDDSDINRTGTMQKMSKFLQEWPSLGLRNINVTTIWRQVDNPLVDQSFHKLSSSLMTSSLSNDIGNGTSRPFKMFQSVSNQALVIEDDYLKMYSSLSKQLKRHLVDFGKSREKSMISFANVSRLYSNILDESDMNKNRDRHLLKVVDAINSYLKNDFHKVRSDVGLCEPVKQAYSDTICCFCNDVFGSWNLWWILLSICSCLVVLSLVFCSLIMEKIYERRN